MRISIGVSLAKRCYIEMADSRQQTPACTWRRNRCHPQDFLGDIHHLFKAHVAKGMYAMQLERWFTLFGRENVKVDIPPPLHPRPHQNCRVPHKSQRRAGNIVFHQMMHLSFLWLYFKSYLLAWLWIRQVLAPPPLVQRLSIGKPMFRDVACPQWLL